ncbi:MAG TPA: YdjY domain-containing protein [Verrucomicrobiae bacterium]|nr:YdjY domain-containing protein [Verrucomicrobiae bacterium]
MNFTLPGRIRFSGFALFGLALALNASLAFGDPPGSSRRLPGPGEGSISPSGKFVPPAPGPTADQSSRGAEEARAALQRALKLSQTGSNTFQIGHVQFDKLQRTITVPARVCIRNQIVEYGLVMESGKTYESLLKTEASPVDLQLAFLLLGLSQFEVGGNLRSAITVPETNGLRIDISWETNSQSFSFELSDLVLLAEKGPESGGHKMSVEKWLYNGSVFDRWGFAAQREGSIVSLIRDPAALINNPGTDRDNDTLHLPNRDLLPPENYPVRVSMHLAHPPVLPPHKLPPWASPMTPLSTNRYDGQ